VPGAGFLGVVANEAEARHGMSPEPMAARCRGWIGDEPADVAAAPCRSQCVNQYVDSAGCLCVPRLGQRLAVSVAQLGSSICSILLILLH
jgi:hypothetical protein